VVVLIPARMCVSLSLSLAAVLGVGATSGVGIMAMVMCVVVAVVTLVLLVHDVTMAVRSVLMVVKLGRIVVLLRVVPIGCCGLSWCLHRRNAVPWLIPTMLLHEPEDISRINGLLSCGRGRYSLRKRQLR
jgi:hypothetical protein